MGFQRMGGYLRIITPDLVQELFTADDGILGPVEILEDRGFFLGQAMGKTASSLSSCWRNWALRRAKSTANLNGLVT